MAHGLEDRFRELQGFSSRHSKRARKQTAAAIALGRKDIDAYSRLQADLRADRD